MQQISSITIAKLNKVAENTYGAFTKAVVDVTQELLTIDAELHADIEAEMLQNGSKQADLWGINLYPANFGNDDFIEFDSMINLRPSQGNRSRFVEDSLLRARISEIVNRKICHD